MDKRTALLGLFCGATSACSTLQPARAWDAETLIGTWEVDLRPRPDAPAYLKSLIVTEVKGNTFAGSFYDSTITDGRLNTAWGTLRLAFVTSDGVGSYYHSAVLSAGRLEGLSHAPHRNLLAYWRAVRP